MGRNHPDAPGGLQTALRHDGRMSDRLRAPMRDLLRAQSVQGVYEVLAATAPALFDRPALVVAPDEQGSLVPVASTHAVTDPRENGASDPLRAVDAEVAPVDADAGPLETADASDAAEAAPVLEEAFSTGEVRLRRLESDDPASGWAAGGEVLAVPLGPHGVWALLGEEGSTVDEEVVELAELLATTAEAELDRLSAGQSLRPAADTGTVDRPDGAGPALEALLAVERRAREAVTREELEQGVCEALVDAEGVAFAWIGGLEAEELVPRCWAGAGEEYLAAVDHSLAGDTGEPAIAAARSERPTTVDDVAGETHSSAWNREALARGFQSAVSVPLHVEGHLTGVLTVFGSARSAFDDRWEAVLGEAADAVGARAVALEHERALYSDAVIELELELTGGDDPFTRIAREAGGAVTFEGLATEDAPRLLVAVEDVDPDRVDAILGETRCVETTSKLAVDEAVLFEISLGDCLPALLSACIERGAVVRSIVADGGASRLVVELGTGSDVGAFVRALETAYDVTLLSRRNRARPARTRRTFLATLRERLTPRQLEVLRTAYAAGYFEWPRESTGEEVAGLLGITQPTFNRHLRTAERKLFEELFADH
ncbi:MAG: bacterio-opsin activator domain-containing protein [Haloarculaceae archaeon]